MTYRIVIREVETDHGKITRYDVLGVNQDGTPSSKVLYIANSSDEAQRWIDTQRRNTPTNFGEFGT